ncbi:hypothetical protein QJQ45_004347 [Haematococcus lacustris]|nr:hypothetical protein QJQ45_004347 [Haematococcus lacustris]
MPHTSGLRISCATLNDTSPYMREGSHRKMANKKWKGSDKQKKVSAKKPKVAPRKAPQAPRSSQEATQPAAPELGPSTPPPAKRNKRTKAEQAGEATQPAKGKGKGKGKAAKAKPVPQPGRWLDRDRNAALNMQCIGESKWRPLELCYWPGSSIMPADSDDGILDRDEALQPDLIEAERNRKADAVQPRVEACSERAVLASLLFGLLVRGLSTIYVADPLGLHDQPVYTDIPVSRVAIPDLSCRNLFLQLCRGLPGNGANTRPNAAVAVVLAAHPDLRARLAAIPRHPSDTNMVDHVGKQLETAFSNMLTLLFAGTSVSLTGAKVLLGTNEHQRRFGFRGLGGGHLPAWSKRQCTYVRRMVCGLDVSWLLEEGGVVPTVAMQAEVALQRGLLGLEEGERVDDDWVKDPANRGRLLCHAVHTTREMEAAMAAWHLDMVPWQQAELISHGLLPRPPRSPTPYALTPTSKCKARHIFIDTNGLYGLMRDAGMLGVLTEEGVTPLAKFRNGALPDPARPGHYIEGPKDNHVANRWDALLPDPRRQKLASPKHSFAQIVHTDGIALSVLFLRPKPAAPPAELPRMGKHMGAVNPLAHLDAEWLGVDPGKTNMATVAIVVSVWQRTLTADQYYRDSGITRQAQATKIWLAEVKQQLTTLSQVSSKPSSLASYRRFADTVLATYDAMWAEVSKPRWANAKFRLYCGKKRVVAGFWSKAILSQALSDPEFARSLRAALFPDGGPAATPSRNGQGDGPVPPGDEEDEEEEQDEEEEADDVFEGEIDLSSADQLAQSLLDTQDQLKEAKTKLARMESRQKLTDRTLAALAEKVNNQAPAAKSVPGPDKWTDNCTKSRRRASAFCDDLEAHCLRFNLDIASVFPAFLSGAARDAWLPSIRAAHFAQTRTAPTWPYLRLSFLEYTGDDLRDDQTDAQKQLLEGSIRMSSQLLLNEYVTAFRNNLLTAGVQCMDESLLVSLFIKGLTSELKKAVLRDSAPFPAFTLAQAIDSARQAQRAAEILAEAVGTKRHVAAVQAKQLTEGLERANNPRPPKSTQSDPPAKVPARSRGFRAGMATGPAAGYRVILKQKAEEAAEQSNMKPGQYCHHCYDPRHLKPLCPYKDMPALEARKLSGYPRPPADAKAAGKRPSEQHDSEPKKGRLASANGKFDVANNQPVICEHYVKVQLRINSFCCMCLLTVMPDLVHAYDVLLGADWLTVQGALVDYVDKTLTLRTPQAPAPAPMALPPAKPLRASSKASADKALGAGKLAAAIKAYFKHPRGTVLPSLRALAQQHGVSRSTLSDFINMGGRVATRWRPTALIEAEEMQLVNIVKGAKAQGRGVTRLDLLGAVQWACEFRVSKGLPHSFPDASPSSK